MSQILETIDWRTSKSDHREVIEAHQRRILNSAVHVRSPVLSWEPELQKSTLSHPEFYAHLLHQIRTGAAEPAELEIIRTFKPDYLTATGIPVAASARWIEFRTRPEDDLSAYAPAELAQLMGRVDEALLALEEGQPKAFGFVQDLTRLLIVRQRGNIKTFFTSSQITHPGRVTLDNLHRASRNQIIEGLVHESVHSYLYMIEERQRFLATRSDPGVFVASPWTGNRICIHSFVHACFVWYSLQTLWLGWQGLKPGARSSEWLENIRRGFQSHAFESILDFNSRLIGESLRKQLMTVREAALAE